MRICRDRNAGIAKAAAVIVGEIDGNRGCLTVRVHQSKRCIQHAADFGVDRPRPDGSGSRESRLVEKRIVLTVADESESRSGRRRSIDDAGISGIHSRLTAQRRKGRDATRGQDELTFATRNQNR